MVNHKAFNIKNVHENTHATDFPFPLCKNLELEEFELVVFIVQHSLNVTRVT